LIHTAVCEEQVENPSEGKSRPHCETYRLLNRKLEHGYTEGCSNEVGPDGHQISNDVGSPARGEKDLKEG